MARRKTIAELESQIANLAPYQEAFFCLNAGRTPVSFRSEGDDGAHFVRVLGASRASGGVVLLGDDGSCVRYVADWARDANATGDPYLRDLVSRVRKYQTDAIKARLEEIRQATADEATARS